MLTATPVQNDLVELYNLLTLLEPGHLKTESHFKKQYIRRGNPRDPRNRERRFNLGFVPGALAGMFVSSDARTFKEPASEWVPTW